MVEFLSMQNIGNLRGMGGYGFAYRTLFINTETGDTP